MKIVYVDDRIKYDEVDFAETHIIGVAKSKTTTKGKIIKLTELGLEDIDFGFFISPSAGVHHISELISNYADLYDFYAFDKFDVIRMHEFIAREYEKFNFEITNDTDGEKYQVINMENIHNIYEQSGAE